MNEFDYNLCRDSFEEPLSFGKKNDLFDHQVIMSCRLLIGILCFFFFISFIRYSIFLYFKSYTLFQVVLFFFLLPPNPPTNS